MAQSPFKADPFPGEPRILFIGLAESTHTHAWIDLLREARFNVRLFALPTPSGYPPEDWPVPTYVSGRIFRRLESDKRRSPYIYWTRTPGLRHVQSTYNLLVNRVFRPEKWLASIIESWQPDIVHVLGMDPAGLFFQALHKQGRTSHAYRWVLQLRGGDLALPQFDPDQRSQMSAAIRACDQLLFDNQEELRIARLLGARDEQIVPLAPVPGTGGVDVTLLRAEGKSSPSERRVIVWPRAYECPRSLSLPVLEALQTAWEAIQPCEIYMLASDETTRMWIPALPEALRAHCHVLTRIPRQQALELMTQARVVLLPSLLDGVPNSMYEAMACGALPIVSPLETIKPVVEEGKHVLFARNLYPTEIAEALTRAMTDDDLVERAAQANLARVREIADRATIAPRVADFYTRLAGHADAPGTR